MVSTPGSSQSSRRQIINKKEKEYLDHSSRDKRDEQNKQRDVIGERVTGVERRKIRKASDSNLKDKKQPDSHAKI